MTTRRLYLVRHGVADAFGELTDVGRRQSDRLGRRLASTPIDVVWHSPLPRAAASARRIARHRPDAPLIEAPELIDHVPYVPGPDDMPPAWRGFFDGFTDAEAAHGVAIARSLVDRFGAIGPTTATRAPADTHELLVTHAYPITWLVRQVLDAPPARWLGLESANTGLTMIEHRDELPPTLVMFNDLTHLPAELRWTGFGGVRRP